MSDFIFYVQEGWGHIISKDALDHQLFLIALAAIYLISDWKKVLVLITAFTVGHTTTLALSVLNIIKISSSWVEFLIPCTIIITALYNFFIPTISIKKIQPNYLLALFFGLIHGLGFANTIRFMLAKNQSMGWSLLGFNIGLEVGQICIVSIILLLSYVCVNIFKVKKMYWIYSLSTVTFLWAVKFAWERLP